MPWIEVEQTGSYLVTVSDGCAQFSHTIEVIRAKEAVEAAFFYVPNCFAPDQDEPNNQFHIYLNNHYTAASFLIRIYDRWGNEMFESRSIHSAWDGNFNGENMQPGVYVWYIEAEVILCGGERLPVFRSGDVTIIR